MIETKYVKHKGEKYYYKIGKASVQEILQHNINRQYPEKFEMMDGEKLYKYVEYDFFHPPEVVEEILKRGETKDTVYKMMVTSKEGTVKYKTILDSFGI